MQTKKPVVIDHDEFLNVLMTGDRSTLKGNVLFGVKLEGLDLSEIDLSDCLLISSSFVGCDFHKSDLSGIHTGSSDVSFIGCKMQGAKFNSADLSTVSLIGCTIMACEMVNADLSRSKVIGSHLITNNLRGVNMVESDLTGTVLQNNDMYNAVGNGVQLKSILCAPWPITYTATELQFASHKVSAAQPLIREDAIKQTHGVMALNTWRKWQGLVASVIKYEPAVAFPDSPFLPASFKDSEVSKQLPGLRVSHENGFEFVEEPKEEQEA